MTNVHKKSLGISIGSDAAECLKTQVSEIVVAYNEELEKEKGLEGNKEVSSLIDTGVVRERFAEILKDGKLFRIEAPKFFDDALKIAGNDQDISPEEAEAFSPVFASHLPDMAIATFSAGIVNDLAAELGEPSSSDEKIIDTDGYIKRTIEGVFAPASGKEISETVAWLDLPGGLLDGEIKNLELHIKELREQEYSFWNYVSAENTLGLSGWAPLYWNMLWGEEERDDCMTLSSAELDGARDYLKDLYSIKTGLNILKDWLETGQVTDNGIYVQAFLQSPFADAANINRNFGLNKIAMSPEENLKAIGRFRIRQALKYGATRLAYSYAERYNGSFPGNDEYIASIMPSRLFQIADNHITGFANATVSLDSLLVISGGILFGKLFGKILGAGLLAKVGSLKWPAKILVPGVTILKFGSRSRIGSFMKTAGNMGFELGKLNLYMFLGSLIDKDDGAEAASKVCLFSGGFASGYMSKIGQTFMREVATGEAGSVSKAVVATGLADDYADALATYSGAPGLKSFSLSKTLSPNEVSKMSAWLKGQTERSVQQAERALERVRDLLSQIRQIARDGAKFTATERHIANAQRIASSHPPPDAIGRLEELRTALRKAISAARGDTVQVTSKTFFTKVPATRGGGKGGSGRANPVKGVGNEGVGTGAGREVAEDAARQRFSLPKILDDYLIDPPRRMTGDILKKATGGRISAENGHLKEVIDIYNDLPAGRKKAFWRAIKDLGSGKTNSWEILSAANPTSTIPSADPAKPLYRGKVGRGYRIFAQPSDDGTFKLIGFKNRGDILMYRNKY